MPSTANIKIDEQNNTGDNSITPLRQAITTIEQKIRNLEKRKAKLESREHNSFSKINETTKSMNKTSGPGAGFMDSYLKFLQSERDTTRLPASRGGRKQSWSRSKMTLQKRKATSNALGTKTADTQNDLGSRIKERKKNTSDGSDDGFSSDDNFISKVIKPEPLLNEKKARRGRPRKVDSGTEKKKAKSGTPVQKQKEECQVHQQKQSSESLPRRESSRRVAKEKSNIKQLIAKENEIEEPTESNDYDSDPAWTPQAEKDPEDDVVKPSVKRRKRGRPAGRKNAVQNSVIVESEEPGVEDKGSQQIEINKKQKTTDKNERQIACNMQLSENIGPSQSVLNKSISASIAEDGLFNPGEFVVIKSELKKQWPIIWRVEGKNLLQKYECFEQNGQTLYRSISMYTSWTPESKKQYAIVPVKYRSQNHLEIVVEFLKSEMTVVDQEVIEKNMKENEMYQDNFEVYIQTLISQALDSNFLTEIFQEQDDYFLSSVKTIDEFTNSKKQKLLYILSWPHPVQLAVNTWPCFNVIQELNTSDVQNKSCAACLLPGVSVRVLLYGQPYNSATLKGCQPDLHITNEKDFLMCKICANRVQLFNKITHQKYLMYIECAKRVVEKRTVDPLKITTCILNELLADQNWLNQLFSEVRSTWGEVDSLEYNYKIKN